MINKGLSYNVLSKYKKEVWKNTKTKKFLESTIHFYLQIIYCRPIINNYLSTCYLVQRTSKVCSRIEKYENLDTK